MKEEHNFCLYALLKFHFFSLLKRESRPSDAEKSTHVPSDLPLTSSNHPVDEVQNVLVLQPHVDAREVSAAATTKTTLNDAQLNVPDQIEKEIKSWRRKH